MKSLTRSVFVLLALLSSPLSASAELLYDSARAPLTELKGEWSFYCEDGFPQSAEPAATPHTIQVPGSWRGYVCPQGKLPGTGRHRYHLVIKGEMRPYGLAIYFPVAGTSMTAYWNGYKIHEAGDVQSGRPGYYPATVPVAFAAVNDLVIDVANFDGRLGGLWHAPQLGLASELREIRRVRFLLDGLVAGLLGFFALYSLLVFASIRERQYVFLAIFALGIALRTLVENERIAHALLGNEYWFALVRVADLSLYATFPFLFALLKSLVGQRRYYWWELLPLSVILLYDILVIVTPPVIFTEFLHFAMLSALLLGIMMLIYVILASLKRQRAAQTFLLAMVLLFAAGIHDLLYNSLFVGFANIELVPFALLGFILLNLITLELKQAWLRRFAARVAGRIQERRSAIERLVPYDAQRFLQAASGAEAMFTAREKIPLRFAALFADLRGFTTLAESRTPEEVLALINQYLSIVVPEIQAHGGQVLEYQGDGILAYFTLGAEQALRAALSMQRALRTGFEKGQLPELRMGIALDFGRGAMTLLGNYQRLEPVIVSQAMLDVQDLELLCSQFQVEIVFTYGFFNELPRELQARARILTDIAGSPVFNLLDDCAGPS